MPDPRYARLADVLVNYSCALEPGDKILIDSIDGPREMVRALVRAAAEAGGVPLVTLHSKAVWRDLMLCGSEEQMRLLGRYEAELMKQVQAYVGLRADPNVSEWSDVPPEKLRLYRRFAYAPVHHDVRVPETRWVIVRWPTPSMAQEARMSTERFEDFYFDVCTMDYAGMSRAMEPLHQLMEATDRVRLVAPETELEFSIRAAFPPSAATATSTSPTARSSPPRSRTRSKARSASTRRRSGRERPTTTSASSSARAASSRPRAAPRATSRRCSRPTKGPATWASSPSASTPTSPGR